MTNHTALLRVELREQIEKLATKQEGYGMSFHAKGLGGRGPATLNVYGDRALAAMWIINHGLAALQAGEEVERVARAIYEAEPIPPGMEAVFGYEAQKALNGPEWVVYAKARAAITALRANAPEAGEVERLRDALKPFADCCDQIGPDEDDEEWAKFRLLIKDYRRAKAALAALPSESDGDSLRAGKT